MTQTVADSPSETGETPARAEVKGTKIKSKLALIESSLGAETLRAVVEDLGPEDRESLRRVLDLGWYPIELYDRLLEAMVRVGADGDPAILDRMGRETAEYQAEHAYKVYFRSGDPRGLLQAMVPMHSQINRPGRIELVDRGERELSLLVYEPPTTVLSCRLARSFYQRALELAGGEAARVVESSCRTRGDDHCRFDVEW